MSINQIFFFPREEENEIKKSPDYLVSRESNESLNHLARPSWQSEFPQGCMGREFISVGTKTHSMKGHLFQILNHLKHFTRLLASMKWRAMLLINGIQLSSMVTYSPGRWLKFFSFRNNKWMIY